MPTAEHDRTETGSYPPPLPSVHPVSPRRLFLVTVALVFAIEFSIMVVLETTLDLSGFWETVLDSAFLALLIAPILLITLHRPLARYVEEVKRSAEELRYSEKKYGTVVENSPAGIFIYRDRRLAFANQRLVKMFGGSREELLQIDPAKLVAPEYREQLAALVDHPVAGEANPEELELRLRATDGDGRWVSVRTTMIQYKGSDSVLGIVQDVTERKRMEEELRMQSSLRLTVQEEERARLARELHDGVGQSLSAIKFLIEHTVSQAYPTEQREHVEQIRALIPKIQDTVEEVRRMSMALRPSTLDDLGLVATITWFLRELQQSCPHIVVEHQLGVVEADIPEPLKIVIYRTLQEALNNAAKHCGECRVLVELDRCDGEIRLLVEDDGDGFDLDELGAREVFSRGYGLSSMRERVELSGGAFTLASEPGGGTMVRATWPMAPQAVTG